MSILFETFRTVSSPDIHPLFVGLGSAAMALPFFAFSFAKGHHEHDENCGCSEHQDTEALKHRISELERLRTKTIEQQEEISDLYVELAIANFENGDEQDEVLPFFVKAENVLRQTLAQGEDAEIRRRLGNVFLHRAVILNDFCDLDESIKYYDKAIEAFKPLEDQGDGEAKYDIAGIKLNRGTIYHELEEFEKAHADFDEAFQSFRAVEKITDLDTRYYMAKVSVNQGALYRDMGEPIEKIVDAYNRAMRLYVELIDLGQLEHEHELANVLMDRCTSAYEACMVQDFPSEKDRNAKINDIIVDVDRGIEILEKLANDGNPAHRLDLFNALATKGNMLLENNQFQNALTVFNRTIKEFADFGTETDPVVLNQFAKAYENRAFCQINLDKPDAALADFAKAIEFQEKIQKRDFDLDDNERLFFLSPLATTYANRANTLFALGKKDQAKADCQKGLDVIRSLRDILGDDADEIESMFKELLSRY